MIGKLIVFSVGLASGAIGGAIGQAIYDGRQAARASFSETFTAVLEGLEK